MGICLQNNQRGVDMGMTGEFYSVVLNPILYNAFLEDCLTPALKQWHLEVIDNNSYLTIY